MQFDTVIRGGRLIDGGEAPPAHGDIGIKDGRVIDAGSDLSHAPAARQIDARGNVVCPGFIDLHVHAASGLRSDEAQRRAAPNMVADGVTTAVVNVDGLGGWPIVRQLREMGEQGIGPNAITLVPHNVIRRRVLGRARRRAATPDEVTAMRALVREGIEQGAWGMSAGLEYSSGRWSTTDELVALVDQVAAFGGVYSSHQRSEGRSPLWYRPSEGTADPVTVLDAVKETIEIGERTGARVIATHIKTKAPWWHRSDEIIGLVEGARERGVDIWADQYSYGTTGSDGKVVLVPKWVFGGDGSPAERLERVLDDAARVSAFRDDVQYEIDKRGGPEHITVMDHPDTGQVGRSLADLAAERGIPAVDVAVALQLEGDRDVEGGARLRGFSLHEDDVDAFMRMPWTACASDGRIMLPDDDPFAHPRRFGNFARRIRRYALDRRVVTLEQAVRSATGLPAKILGLRDRGMLRAGYAADVVVFDPGRVRDVATVDDPHRYSEGIEHVLVNGVAVVDDGKPTLALPGKPVPFAV